MSTFCKCGCGKTAPITRGSQKQYIKGHHFRKAHLTVDSILERCVTEPTSGCWFWEGSKLPSGYGKMQGANGAMAGVHRIVFELVNGPISDVDVVCHRCDIPECCNPAHLFVGTQADNVKDKVAKGRQLMGETHPNRKLSECDVLNILNSPDSLKSTAEKYGVSASSISKIRNGKAWNHVRR